MISKTKSALKVITIVGTRPELIKLSRVIPLLDEHTQHTLVHTGQNFSPELNEVFFNEMRIRKPDHVFSVAGSTPMNSIAKILESTDQVLESVRPDAILVLGDTNSALSVIAAKRRKIPIFHLEAGNRSFDQRTPEEVNRKIVDHTSDINLTYSEHARRNLLHEGFVSNQIFNVGSPLKEIFDFYKLDFDKSKILTELQSEKNKYFVVSLHREENVDDSEKLTKLIKAIESTSDHFDHNVIFSTHPRTKERLSNLNIKFSKRINFITALGFFDFIKLQQNAFCVISDSGTLTEEASLLGFPAVTLRDAHERPEGTDNGTLILSGSSANQLVSDVAVVRAQFDSGNFPKPISDYEVSDVSWRVVKIILSYVEYVNKRVWFK
jgi:UDP-N-acetylglucosamine 2-epimerase (non-hydrolysing)